jgi:hypothetical protein
LRDAKKIWIYLLHMGFFDSLRSGFQKVYDFGRGAFNKVIDIGSKVRDGIRAGYDTVRNLPVIGGIVERAVNAPLPFVGRSLRDIGNVASDGLDIATSARDRIYGRPSS